MKTEKYDFWELQGMRWSEREKRLGILLLLSGLVLVSLILYQQFGRDPAPPMTFPAYQEEQDSTQEPASGQSNQPEPPVAPVVVDVKGAVKHPGVYSLPAGARVVDAIERAGGLLEEADPDRINLAQPLTDGMAFRVPFQGEQDNPPSEPSVAQSAGVSGSLPGAGKVNINTATEAELDTLPGIGPAKAAAIVKYREEHGPFQEIGHLTRVPGIGEKTFQNLQDLITVH
jgi:competence protein ComEA